MFTCEITNGIDEYNHERRRRIAAGIAASEREPCVALDTCKYRHRLIFLAVSTAGEINPSQRAASRTLSRINTGNAAAGQPRGRQFTRSNDGLARESAWRSGLEVP